MCGRTACTLAPDEICRACTYKDKSGRDVQPDWRDSPNGKTYFTSHNTAPGAYTPVLLQNRRKTSEDDHISHVIQPMQWGLVPHWHKGDPKQVMYKMNNCRGETMTEKRSFKVPLERGQRCVVLADGFYEWKRDGKTSKQPYYIYFGEDKGEEDSKGDHLPADVQGKCETDTNIKCETDTNVKCENDPKVKSENETSVKCEMDTKVECEMNTLPMVKSDTDSEFKSETDTLGKSEADAADKSEDGTCIRSELHHNETDLKSVNLLKMAAVYDIWKPDHDSAPVFSYSVITVHSSPAMDWLHDRMPAILRNDREVDMWIDSGSVPLKQALELIRPVECIKLHAVSTLVNNSRNNSPDCIKPYTPSKPKPSAGSNFMMNWLSKGSQKHDIKTVESPAKKMKLEPS